MNNIYLIGMPGCGKSTIGKILSQDMSIEHIDADVYLEKKYNISIADIFAHKGEDVFRDMESETISELSLKSDVIISTGGGVVTRTVNKSVMKNSGIVVFIDSHPDKILANSSLDGRPLLKDKNRIFDLYKQRLELYHDFADITVDNNGNINDTVISLKQALMDLNFLTKGIE